jgi:hypothetical protein
MKTLMSHSELPISFFNMLQKLISRVEAGPAIALFRRFAVRYAQPILVRPFKGPPERRPIADGLKQIAGTLRVMGVLPGDSIVKQIGSEFRLLFCAEAPQGKMKSPPRGRFADPAKSISDLLRKPVSRTRNSTAIAALKRLLALCKRAQILSRLRRSFL